MRTFRLEMWHVSPPDKFLLLLGHLLMDKYFLDPTCAPGTDDDPCPLNSGPQAAVGSSLFTLDAAPAAPDLARGGALLLCQSEPSAWDVPHRASPCPHVHSYSSSKSQLRSSILFQTSELTPPQTGRINGSLVSPVSPGPSCTSLQDCTVTSKYKVISLTLCLLHKTVRSPKTRAGAWHPQDLEPGLQARAR